MAVDSFLKIDDVKGESADGKHAGFIDILAWSWGSSQTATTHTGSGGGAGKVSVQDLSISKHVDRASPTLLGMCFTGKHSKQAVLTVRKAGDRPLEYLKITMEDVLISSVSFSGSPGDERLSENLTLNFSRVKFEYTPQKSDGSGDAVVPTGFDIAKNQKWG